MRLLMPKLRKDVSSGGDSALVLAVDIGTFFLCALLLLNSEAMLLLLFLAGAAYPLALGYLVLVFYFFLRMLWRRDAWLLYFLCTSATFVTFLAWVLSSNIISHRNPTGMLTLGLLPYSFVSIAFGMAMLRGHQHRS